MRQLIGIGVASVLALSVLVMAQVSDDEAERLLKLYKQRNAERKAKAATKPATTRPKPKPRSRPRPKVRRPIVKETLTGLIKALSVAMGKPEHRNNPKLTWDSQYNHDTKRRERCGPEQIVQMTVSAVGDQSLRGNVLCGKDSVTVGVTMLRGQMSVEDRIRFSKTPIGTTVIVRGNLDYVMRETTLKGEVPGSRRRLPDGRWRVSIINERGGEASNIYRSLREVPKTGITVKWYVNLANCVIVK